MCSFSSFELLRKHLTSVHDIQFAVNYLEFDSEPHFCEWKEKTEKETKSFYLLNSTAESTPGKVFYYECHRSNLGKFESKCTIRAPKISGSIKISGVCPSRIKAEVNHDTSIVSVVYVSTHVGHKSELRCQPLPKNEKCGIIEQIRLGVSYNTVPKSIKG